MPAFARGFAVALRRGGRRASLVTRALGPSTRWGCSQPGPACERRGFTAADVVHARSARVSGRVFKRPASPRSAAEFGDEDGPSARPLVVVNGIFAQSVSGRDKRRPARPSPRPSVESGGPGRRGEAGPPPNLLEPHLLLPCGRSQTIIEGDQRDRLLETGAGEAPRGGISSGRSAVR